MELATELSIIIWFFACNSLALLFFILIEIDPRFFFLYDRLQDNYAHRQLSKSEIIETIKNSGWSQILVIIPLFFVIFNFGRVISEELPSIFEFSKEQLLLVLVEESLFYFVHRLMHTKWLYAHFHYKHHVPMAIPYSLSGIINDPMDAAIFFLLTWSGVFFVETHLLTIMTRIPWVAWLSFYSHSQLIAKFDPQRWFSVPFYFDYPGVHLMHHWQPKSNYGMHTKLFDRLFGTDKAPPLLKIKKSV